MSALRPPINTDLIWGADEIDGLCDNDTTRDQAAIGSLNLLRALAAYHFKRAKNLTELNHWKALAQ